MKKRLLIGAMLMGSIYSGTSQELFNVNFSDDTALTDWLIIDADGDGFNWGVRPENSNTVLNGFTGEVAFSESFDNEGATALTPDNSFLTQSFTVPTGEPGSLSFKVGAQDPLFPTEHYAVYVVNDAAFTAVLDGIDAGTSTIADYTALLVNPLIEETLTTAVASTKTLSLTAYAGEPIRVVFRHYDVTDQFILLIDDVTVNVGATAGINENFASKFSVYPNPANTVVNINNTENILINNISIVDINGRAVKTVNFSGTIDTQINISDLSSGVYMMNITSDMGNTTKKIIKN